MTTYSDFIPQNIAPVGAKRIGIYNEAGIRVGNIPLGNLVLKNTGEKLYTFLLLSDVHIVYDTGVEDTQRAMKYANDNTDIDFICITGDIGKDGTENEFQSFKSIVDANCPNKPIYISAGNHEYYRDTSNGYYQQYIKNPLYYSVEQGNDLFIMLGVISGTEGELFEAGELQWLYNTLENNRNKRVFLLEHILTCEGSGDALGLYPHTKLTTKTESKVFKSLLQHYTNVIFLHGHSHMRFSLQKYSYMANYDNVFGCHSVHIPSIAIPRQANENLNGMETYYEGSEGYVVDVYENGIHLRGRDFVKGEFLPIASYWLDTTLQTIEAGTFTDSTGTITTQ